MGSPTFSVVVPCYNYGRYLRQCVESVVRQGPTDVEIIVVNDASSDDSATVIRALDAEHSLTVISHATNLGLVAALNSGIARASGEYVMALSADDLLAPAALHRLASLFEHDASIGLAYGPRTYFHDPRSLPSPEAYELTAERVEPADMFVHDGRRWLERRCHHGVNPLTSPEVALRRSVQMRIGEYDSACRHTSDLNMWLRAAAISNVGFVDGPSVAYYRRHESNMSEVQFGTHAADLHERWIAYDRALPQGDGDTSTSKLRALARRTVTDQALTRARRAQEDDRSADAAELVSVARSIDPVHAAKALRCRADGTSGVRPRYVHRLVRRMKVHRWRRQWERSGI